MLIRLVQSSGGLRRFMARSAEIRELLSLRANGRRERTAVRALTQAKIADVDGKIRTLKAMKTALDRLTDRCSGCGPVSECPILESIDSEEMLR